MKKWSKVLAMLLIGIMLLTGCGNGAETTGDKNDGSANGNGAGATV